jgi:putative ABC transport system permease protein
MKTPLPWLNLLHNKAKTLIAVSGVAFAVVLMFLQLGFLYAVQTTATLVYNALEFDVLLRSNDYLHIADTRSFPRKRLVLAESHPLVASAYPFYLEINQWRVPNGRNRGTKRGILTLAARPGDPVFSPRMRRLQQTFNRLELPDEMLVDQLSRREFGDVFREQSLGMEVEVGGHPMRIAGHYRLGTGMAANGAVVMRANGFASITPGRSIDDVSLGLIKLRPGADAGAVARDLDGMMRDVVALTKRETMDRELRRWVWEMPIGIIFVMGVVVAVFVGTAIVYQVLSSDVANRLAEYATLKAMGYTSGYLAGVVLQQAVALALLGFLPGLALSLLIYLATNTLAKIPMGMNVQNFSVVFVLTIAMCIVSGLASLRKLGQVDPAELF